MDRDFQTAFFFVYSVGHCGGSWLGQCVNCHPAGMSLVGEVQYPNQLDLSRRGIPKDRWGLEVIRFFEDRIHYEDVAVGATMVMPAICVQWARRRMGEQAVRTVQILRNPLFKFGRRWKVKQRTGARRFQAKHGRPPDNEQEICEGVSEYFAASLFKKSLSRSNIPIIRLEDINRSLNKDGAFFKRLMEWLTQTEWPWSYIQHIRDNWTPAYRYSVSWEQDDEGRFSRVSNTRYEKPTWDRDWSDDPQPALYWDGLTGGRREAYLKYHAGCQARLGYNQSGPGTVEADWEFRGAYPWGEI